jgi:hypothetical protein
LPELLVAVRDARVALAGTRGRANSSEPRVEQRNLFRALSDYARALTELGLPVPYAISSELHVYQDLVGPLRR